jgi:prepilin-type N-terminal cleavage/methylation domain-containing protein
MKLKSSEITGLRKLARAFTLIEMIGVLAVIAILAALLIPKVFGAINDARINSAVVGAQTVKTALIDHYGKYGRWDSVNGTVMPSFGTPFGGYDTNVLMAESLLEKPFATKVGTNSWIEVDACPAANTTVTGGPGTGYNLSGNGTTSETSGQYVVEAVITSVTEADAQAISQRIDGPALSVVGTNGVPDYRGRVKYGAPGPDGTTTVYIYLAHH